MLSAAQSERRDRLSFSVVTSESQGDPMHSVVKMLFVGAILASGSIGAAPSADPVIGTWKLNVAKSKFAPGPAPKAQTRSYGESAQGTTLTLKTTAADGKETTISLTFKDDGKPYPATGNPDFDTVMVSRVDALTVHSTQMKGGATVGTGVRTVSKDAKTLTFAQKGTHASGVAYDNVLVYDRQ